MKLSLKQIDYLIPNQSIKLKKRKHSHETKFIAEFFKELGNTKEIQI